MRAPTAKELSLNEHDVYDEMCRLSGSAPATTADGSSPSRWPLHLKHPPFGDLKVVQDLKVEHEKCKEFLFSCFKYFVPGTFLNLHTSRTLKSTRLPRDEIQQCIDTDKFIKMQGINEPLLKNQHGVNIFDVEELKRRRRLISDSNLNSVVPTETLPRVHYPSRAARRCSLRYAKYMLQIDFDAFYDAIALPPELYEFFLFKKGSEFFALKTLPTGAKWSVCVAQSITWVICDFPSGITKYTIIDNILLAGREDQAAEFVEAVRTLAKRISKTKFQTSPPANELLGMTDRDILKLGEQENTFAGETYVWNGKEREIKNSIKTVAKINLMRQKTEFTYRSFTSFVCLLLFAMHTVNMNPAACFHLMRAYRGVAKEVASTGNWDAPLPFVSVRAKIELEHLSEKLSKNELAAIPALRQCTYADDSFDTILYVDASHDGWAAYVRKNDPTRTTSLLQQRWVNALSGGSKMEGEAKHGFFYKFSAHAEPAAICTALKFLRNEGRLQGKVAVVTDHYPVVQAQRKENLYGGIGRGLALNSLFAVANEGDIYFFYIAGEKHPSDHASRNFPSTLTDCSILETAATVNLPRLAETYCPLCETQGQRQSWMI